MRKEKGNVHFGAWEPGIGGHKGVGEGPRMPPLHRQFLGFLRDWNHLTKKFALESVAFLFLPSDTLPL